MSEYIEWGEDESDNIEYWKQEQAAVKIESPAPATEVKTYTITKGHQYDRDGVCVEWHYGNTTLYTNYSASGSYDSGDMMRADEQVKAAILRVAATGQAETVLI